ncbi:GDSL-type esterase/lipase family protein [Nocardioides zeae]|uniref:Lipase n=1 Tax=Nocardioides zeae TaxID=1457234 RepID=A0A6P0HE82_9ACTN|nr:SGNH/GDSL hydrolase family protein [Nocardioides zeae]NEN77079.1 lipase [Nocardioides zeae]
MTGLHDVPLTPEHLRGAVEVEHTPRGGLLPHRLPAWARVRLPDPQLLMVEAQPSGVRLALRTAATVLELEARATKRVYVGVPPRPDGVYEVVVGGAVVASGSVGGGDVLSIDMGAGTMTRSDGGAGVVRFAGLPGGPGVRDVEVWLPHDEQTELVALRADAPVAPVPVDGRRRWLHHGSSISHGSNAATPTGTWPAVAAALADVDLLNLGFGGSALLDPSTARAMRDLPADAISVKLGINLVNADLMRLRALAPAVHGFLDTIREGHPTTPLLVVSSIFCGIHEDTPGPAMPDMEAAREGRVRFVATGDPAEVARGRLTLRVVREQLAAVVAQRSGDDPHLAYLDGTVLYGEADAQRLPLPDGLHPDAATHRLIGGRFAAAAFGAGGPLG